ncbi:MAG: CAP domain-containing protein [Clostridia bacterium]|nr:CAP domain-containing protein [Clostridia bacterium]
MKDAPIRRRLCGQLLPALLVAAILLTAAACGTRTADVPAETEPTATTAATTVPTTTAAPTTTEPTTTTTTEPPTTTTTTEPPTTTTTKAPAKTAKTPTYAPSLTTREPEDEHDGTYIVSRSSNSETYDLKYGVRLRRTVTEIYHVYADGTRVLADTEIYESYPRRDYHATYDELLPAARANQNTYADQIEEVLRITNSYRKAAGLPALKLSNKLCEQASVRAEEIAWSGDHDHYRPNGRYFSSIFKENGYEEGLAGENLGWGYKTPKGVCEAWKASTTHYENIVNPRFNYIGIGVAADPNPDGNLCWVQHFYE